MNTLAEALKGDFTAVNLGCIGDMDYQLPQHLIQALTLVEVDAEGSSVTKAPYHRKVTLREPISGTAGRRTFRRNSFAGTCSLLEPQDGMVAAYGMERYCQLLDRIELDCKTLPDLLRAEGVRGMDFLKTDLEGLDYEIIRSCQEHLGRILCLQCELRFRPFYQGEPYFHEVINYLVGFGYEVMDILHIDRWKYKTNHWEFQVEGHAVWGDFLFFLQPQRLEKTFAAALQPAAANHFLWDSMLGSRSEGDWPYAAYSTG